MSWSVLHVSWVEREAFCFFVAPRITGSDSGVLLESHVSTEVGNPYTLYAGYVWRSRMGAKMSGDHPVTAADRGTRRANIVDSSRSQV